MGIKVTRKRLLAAGAGGALASAAAGGALAGRPGLARSAPSARQDVRVLEFVLGLERIEAAFYGAAQQAGALKGELAEYAEVVGGQEREHVAFLEKALNAGGAEPKLDVDDVVRDERRFAATAIALEDAMVWAYNGQAANLTPQRLAQAATIASVEARHAAWIRDVAGEPPASRAVDPARTAAEVRRILRAQRLLP
jgi:Ferritin-like domain